MSPKRVLQDKVYVAVQGAGMATIGIAFIAANEFSDHAMFRIEEEPLAALFLSALLVSRSRGTANEVAEDYPPAETKKKASMFQALFLASALGVGAILAQGLDRPLKKKQESLHHPTAQTCAYARDVALHNACVGAGIKTPEIALTPYMYIP